MTLIADYKERVNALPADRIRAELAHTEATIADLKTAPDLGKTEREAVLGFWRLKREAVHEALTLCMLTNNADAEQVAQAASEALLAPRQATCLEIPCQHCNDVAEYRKSLLIDAAGRVLFGPDRGKTVTELVTETIGKAAGKPVKFKTSEVKPAWWLMGKPVRRLEVIAGA